MACLRNITNLLTNDIDKCMEIELKNDLHRTFKNDRKKVDKN